MNQLETDYENYNINYDNQFPSTYTVDQLDSIDDARNFDEFKTVRDFENLFSGYVSKRIGVENTENSWLNNNFSGLDPDSLDRTFDDFENAVFNANYAFKIGTDLYELRADGMYLNGVNQGGGSGANSSPNGTTVQPMSPPDQFGCLTKRVSQFFNIGSNQRLKVKAAVHNIIIRGSAKGKVVAFKQKGGKWKRRRYQMAIDAGGYIYTINCGVQPNLNLRKPSPNGYYKRKDLVTVYRKSFTGDPVNNYLAGMKTKHGQWAAFAEKSDGTSTPSVTL